MHDCYMLLSKSVHRPATACRRDRQVWNKGHRPIPHGDPVGVDELSSLVWGSRRTRIIMSFIVPLLVKPFLSGFHVLADGAGLWALFGRVGHHRDSGCSQLRRLRLGCTVSMPRFEWSLGLGHSGN
jgi:hypothetical protein